jgi:2,3-bisphosphoglycerate-independent phosphoglycerate mutase
MFLQHPLPNQLFLTMTPYKKEFNNPTIFGSTIVTRILGEIISEQNYKQLRMAETEKIAMVSYFFNGQSEHVFVGEDHEFVDSPKVTTYDLVPAMSTEELVKRFSENFKAPDYVFGLLNIACPDMVAHTGKIEKTIEAIKAADLALGELINLAKETDSYLVITADHGNAEELINNETGNIDTEHSGSLVPLIIFHPTDNQFKLVPGKLGDVAPTILKLLEIEKPVEMTGTSLIVI